MRIKKLVLNNFQGQKKLELDFDGKSASIYGDNATGKTTVFNAFTWVLFDKASTGAKNFSPKTTEGDGFKHGLDHSAEAVCQMEDGRIVSFKKVFKEVYKKTRGSAVEEFSGHTTEYFIDGVPAKEKEYNDAILNYLGKPEQLKMLTMPHYFAEDMKWEDRRKILLDICGDISDEEVIESTKELKDLKNYLLINSTEQSYTVEEYKKISSAKMSEINKKIQSIPDRVDEASRAMPDVEGLDITVIEKKIAEYEKKKEDLEVEKRSILSGDTGSSEIRKQIAEEQVNFAEAKVEYSEKSLGENSKTQDKVNEIGEKYNNIKQEYYKTKDLITLKENEIEKLEEIRIKLTAEYKKVFALNWDESEGTCPTCKQDLPQEQVEKAREQFNLNKSNKLEEINEKGKKEASKEMLVKLKEELKSLELSCEEMTTRLATLTKTKGELQSQLKDVTPFESTTKAKEINNRIQALKDQEHNGYTDVQMLGAGVTKQIILTQEKIREQENNRAKFGTIEVQKKRIQDLMEEETTLAKEYENLQKGIYLCETFTRTKVSMLDSKINGRFKNVRFRLFQEQINGGLREDCEVLVPGESGQLVPFSIANNAGRINAGLEIIDTLGKHWGISMPVFVDNAESVTKLVETDAQVIRLVVPAPFESIMEKPLSGHPDVIAKWEELKAEYETKNKKLRLEKGE